MRGTTRTPEIVGTVGFAASGTSWEAGNGLNAGGGGRVPPSEVRFRRAQERARP
jgi:hypothetical protein